MTEGAPNRPEELGRIVGSVAALAARSAEAVAFLLERAVQDADAASLDRINVLRQQFDRSSAQLQQHMNAALQE